MLNMDASVCKTHTYKEILQQPVVWKAAYDLLLANKAKVERFIEKHFGSETFEIVFSGAGTSAYIGDILSVYYAEKGYYNCRSVPTTDIITHPEAYLPTEKKLVLISFARSGSSPESIATVELANKLCREVVHIIITCNKDGVLARSVSADDLLLLLPPETNDQSLAMTSSFSTMLLTGLLLIDIASLEEKEPVIRSLCANAQHTIDTYLTRLQEIAALSFSRVIFLGSGELKGIVEECHLKVQEMTDGKVICKYDSFLGFRHGPKAAINESTLLVYLFSDDDYVFAYEKDLVQQINSNNKVVGQIAVCCKMREIPSVNFTLEMILCKSAGRLPGGYDFIIHVLTGQLLALFKSVDLKHNPDSPSVSGNIARVVEGVEIYAYQP